MMREVDPELHQHLQRLEFLPELSLLKWLRVLFSREFTLNATLTIWDYIFADVDYQLVQQRKYEKLIPGQKQFYQQDEYMMGAVKDYLVNMDYLALAMFQNVRPELLEGETQLECMQIFMVNEVIDWADSLITISERIKKVMDDQQERRSIKAS